MFSKKTKTIIAATCCLLLVMFTIGLIISQYQWKIVIDNGFYALANRPSTHEKYNSLFVVDTNKW